jgi:cardiolipin synthase
VPVWRNLRSFIVFHFLRRFPAWAGWLPAHVPRLSSLKATQLPQGADSLNEKAWS